ACSTAARSARGNRREGPWLRRRRSRLALRGCQYCSWGFLCVWVWADPSDRGQPVMVFGIAAMHCIEKGGLQFFGDGAATPGANAAVVDFPDGRDLGSRAREEGFVGDVEIVARDAAGAQFDAEIGGQ